jgi:hypothetical protein
MIDYYLKFPSEAAAQAVLFDVEKLKYTYIDQIGVIYKPTGKTVASESSDTPEMAPVDGWHVNVRHVEEAPELDEFVVVVDSPVRVWC